MTYVISASNGVLKMITKGNKKPSWFRCTSNAFLMANGIQSLFQSSWVDVISPTRDSIASNRRRWSPDATAISVEWGRAWQRQNCQRCFQIQWRDNGDSCSARMDSTSLRHTEQFELWSGPYTRHNGSSVKMVMCSRMILWEGCFLEKHEIFDNSFDK
jgi:hypothetical protein